MSAGRARVDVAMNAGTSPPRKSSSLVVMTARTAVVPPATTPLAVSSYSDSRHTSTVAPESDEQELELTRLVHGVDRHHGPARLPRGHHGQHELRDVLEVHGEPVALPEAVGHQRGGEGVGGPVDLGGGEAVVEVLQEHVVGPAGHRGAEHVEARRELGLDVARHAGVVLLQPGSVVVAHVRSLPPLGAGAARTGTQDSVT